MRLHEWDKSFVSDDMTLQPMRFEIDTEEGTNMQDTTRKEYAWDQKLHVSRGACRQIWLLPCTAIGTKCAR